MVAVKQMLTNIYNTHTNGNNKLRTTHDNYLFIISRLMTEPGVWTVAFVYDATNYLLDRQTKSSLNT